ncbi:hypothetical protein AFK68_21110 [Hydrocoleum sp. CS-953]|uniref:hypothetical protein n=1 Tax=Hydrocoleum sp. CS-953 TaxID=1671698 RepID=UPI000B9C0928|nr:hypothetical protein [Hydrocoleum sp. CS-953]OZH52929.1 hypothetical protein AFK68_21110 [Hydrocoleum sp. CS-953]
MATNPKNPPEEKLAEFTKLLESSRKLQADILNYGLDAAEIYVEDVDGDWLENWDSNTYFDSIIFLLESDDLVAVRVREKLREKSTSEIASELEKMWQISDEDDRILAVKKLLVGGVNVASSNRDISDKNEEDGIELLELAEELLEKLDQIFEEQE